MSDYSMSVNQYQEFTRDTAMYPGAGEGDINAILYTTLGLSGEAGEIPNKVKKILRDDNGVLSEEKRLAILAEIGDVLWYAARLADELGARLGDVAEANIEKLEDRANRGVIQGSGDYR
ncbi:MazG-like nucleotide pyrophosphohydrolase [Streptomyces phage Patelgo]|nr:MazG-like nucleotide pyrophosphohydrolase [Streptomyces phage Patelgo]